MKSIMNSNFCEIPVLNIKTNIESKEMFYRLLNPPVYVLAREPACVLPRRVIPVDPEREIPGKIIPERRIDSVHVTLDVSIQDKCLLAPKFKDYSHVQIFDPLCD